VNLLLITLETTGEGKFPPQAIDPLQTVRHPKSFDPLQRAQNALRNCNCFGSPRLLTNSGRSNTLMSPPHVASLLHANL